MLVFVDLFIFIFYFLKRLFLYIKRNIILNILFKIDEFIFDKFYFYDELNIIVFNFIYFLILISV